MKKILSLLTILLITNCASIVSKSNYDVKIQSSSDKVNFVIKDRYGFPIQSGQTPAQVNLKSGDGYFKKAVYLIEYEKDGKKAFSRIEPSLDGWYAGNIIFGGLIGILIVDPATGAMYKLPKAIYGNI